MGMKAVVLAIMALLAAGTGANAGTYVSGFNPRFGTAPQNPNNPDYRPPDRPRSTFDFDIEIGVGDWWDRDADRDRPRRRHRDGR
jgi:hypothetical protein